MVAGTDTIAIVGLSLAGLRAVEAIRRAGFTGRVVAISAEHDVAYDRPPLSEELLAREPGDIALRRQGLDDLDVHVRRGVRAARLDVAGRELVLDDGATLAFDGLVIATGATPRRLPTAVCPADLAGVHVLRTLDEALA